MGNSVAAAAVAGAQASGKQKGAKQAPASPDDKGGIRALRFLTESSIFRTFILGCIIANAVILGYDAHSADAHPTHILIEHWNVYFLWIFTAELFLEFFAQGPRRYFKRRLEYLSMSSSSPRATSR